MAHIYGNPGKTPGEQLVCSVLQALPAECIVYAEPKLAFRSEARYPDFVIVYHLWGVIVLEVKDWTNIEDRDRKKAWLPGRPVPKTSPVEQARQAAHVLEKMLMQDDDLRSYAGGLDFYYAYGGVLPYLPQSTITWLEKEWGENYLLGKQDLYPDRITDKLSAINGFSVNRIMMEEDQVRAVCAIIDPRNKAQNHETGEFKGVYSRIQEQIAKELLTIEGQPEPEEEQSVQASMDLAQTPSPEARLQHLEAEMPDEVKDLKGAHHVRLLRGFAGTGKTDVLILRTHHLHEKYADFDILVTTFNDPLYRQRLVPELESLKPRVDVIKCDTLCSQIYRKKHGGQWVKPQSTEGLVAVMASRYPLIEELGRDFVSDEFIWMKEIGRTDRQDYISQVREGRGSVSQRTLGRRMKEQIFDLFEAYERELRELPAHDWVDLHDKTLRYLKEGVEPDKRYDVILIDEAQHFAPTWMRIVDHFLKPGGHLFLCDDPSQSVFRYYSWRQKGVEVVGRTRWLRIPYRNTRQIFEAAYSLIADNPLARKRLAESGEEVHPDLDSVKMRDGDRPQVHHFPSVQEERDFVAATITALIASGMIPGEIGILHEKKDIISAYRRLVPEGVQLHKIKRQTGLEYKAVFVPQVQRLLERKAGMSWEEDKARNLLKCYMTMTRARDRLYLLHCQQWPSPLDPIQPHVDWIEH